MKTPAAAWRARQQHRRKAQAVGEALAAVRAAALERPLPAARLNTAAATAVTTGAPPLRVVRAAMTGASMSSPDDPADFEHRQQACTIVRQAVYGTPPPAPAASVKEEP